MFLADDGPCLSDLDGRERRSHRELAASGNRYGSVTILAVWLLAAPKWIWAGDWKCPVTK